MTTPVGRLDEATAARRPDLRHDFGERATEPAKNLPRRWAPLNPDGPQRVVFDTNRRFADGVPVVTKQPDGLVERMQSGDLDAFEEFFNDL